MVNSTPNILVNRNLDGPRAGVDFFGEEKNLSHLPGLETWILQPVAWLCKA